MVRRDRPRAGERAFKIAVGQKIRPDFRHAARHDLHVVDEAVARRGEIHIHRAVQRHARRRHVGPVARVRDLSGDFQQPAVLAEVAADGDVVGAARHRVARVRRRAAGGDLRERRLAREPRPVRAGPEIRLAERPVEIREEAQIIILIRAVAIRAPVPVAVKPVVRALLARELRDRVRDDLRRERQPRVRLVTHARHRCEPGRIIKRRRDPRRGQHVVRRDVHPCRRARRDQHRRALHHRQAVAHVRHLQRKGRRELARHREVGPDESEIFARVVQAEVRVQRASGHAPVLVRREDDEVAVRRDVRRREGPLDDVRPEVREIPAQEVHGVGVWIVNFHPVLRAAVLVEERAGVGGGKFRDDEVVSGPQRRDRSCKCQHDKKNPGTHRRLVRGFGAERRSLR